MIVKLTPKYLEIQRILYQNHKVKGFDASAKTTNKLIEEISKMIVEAIQLSQENKEDTDK